MPQHPVRLSPRRLSRYAAHAVARAALAFWGLHSRDTLKLLRTGEPMLTVYVAASFKHKHGVRLLGRELHALGCRLLDWTEKATPPPGLTPMERRIWMDTDQDGGQVYGFCRDACLTADLVVYYGASGQDAGVEVGLAAGAGVPVLGIRGPLEGAGLMLHGAVTAWVDSVEEALDVLTRVLGHAAAHWRDADAETDPAARRLALQLRARESA